MKSVDFLFVYEVKARELENICLIAAELEKMGYTTAFVNSWHCLKFPEEKNKYSCKVCVISAGYNTDTIQYFASHCASFNYIVNLQWEQLMTSELIDKHDYIWFFKDLAYKIDHISWGQWNYNRLTNICGVPKENVAIAGNVTLDILRDRFKPYLNNKKALLKKYKLDKYQKVSLFVSSFTLINLPKEVTEQVAEALNVEAMGDISERSQAAIIKWFLDYLESNPTEAIIYRPHPTEIENKELLQLANQYSNFYVISDLSIKPWIVACDKIYTWFSTAVGEIWANGKSCYILRPYEWTKGEDLVVYENAKFVITYADFLDCQASVAHSFPISEEQMRYFYDYDLATPAYKKVATVLANCLSKKEDYSVIVNNIALQNEYLENVKKIKKEYLENISINTKKYKKANPFYHKLIDAINSRTNFGFYPFENFRDSFSYRNSHSTQLLADINSYKNFYTDITTNAEATAFTDIYTQQMIKQNFASEKEIDKIISKFKKII